MPDRTQTLSGLERFFLGCSEGHSASSEFLHVKGPWVRFSDAAALLSQPEHQGDGRIGKLEALEPDWDSYGGKVPTAEALERLRGFDRALAYVPLADGGVQVEFHALGLDFEAEIDPTGQVIDVDLQPPAPVLSDEEKAHLLEVARDLELGKQGYERHVRFLRNLASQEHPASTQGEPAVQPGFLQRSLDRAHEAIQGRPDYLKPERYRRGEGGDEEDWPAAYMRLIRPGKLSHCDPACAHQRDVRRYVPAALPAVPSGPSVLEEELRAALNAARSDYRDLLKAGEAGDHALETALDRAKAAESQREAAVRAGIAHQGRADKAETAIEELAAELERRAERAEIDAYSSGLQTAALCCREMAAALKGNSDAR